MKKHHILLSLCLFVPSLVFGDNCNWACQQFGANSIQCQACHGSVAAPSPEAKIPEKQSIDQAREYVRKAWNALNQVPE